MKLTTSEADDLLDELAKLDIQTRQPGDIDRYQYAEKLGLTVRGVESRLKDFVSQGILIELQVYDPDKKRRVTVYRKPTEL